MSALATSPADREDRASRTSRPATQSLVLVLDGITPADYLAHVRDPEPAALARDLLYVRLDAEPLGDTIRLELVWARPEAAPASPALAAATAGFPLIPEVVAVLAGGL